MEPGTLFEQPPNQFEELRAMNLNQVTLPSTDVARDAAFYRLLGFTQIVANYPEYGRFECPAGGSTFSLHRVTTTAADNGVIIYFECDDVDKTYAELTGRGITFDAAPANQPWLWREAYLKDPNGNVLCLYQAGENRRNPPWRLP
jgi:catechol 2,3-dioxygenase-like lactoylglutathione lyase family enzyme